MTLWKKLLALSIGVLLAAGLTAQAATADALSDIKSHGTVKIGMLVDFPPYGIVNASNEPDGYDADVAKALAKDLGVKLQLVPVTGPNRIPYLLSGQVDILVASLGITPERAKKVDYSQPYAGITISVFGQKGVQVTDAAGLSGKTVGVARASTQDVAITKIAPKDANIHRFDDDASAVQALLSGQVQLIGCSNTVIAQVEKAAPGKFDEKFRLSSQVQGIAIKPGEPQLLAAINGFLDKAKKDGTLERISEKWLGAPLPDNVAGAGK